MKYYTGKIEYFAPVEGGDSDEVVSVKQTYLVEAVSVTDVEEKLIKMLPDNYKDKHVMSVGSSTISEILTIGDSETYYLARVGMPYDTKKGPKMGYSQIMVNGDNLLGALTDLNKLYERNGMEYELAGISKSNMVCDPDLVTIKKALNL